MAISWRDAMSLGVPEIDSDHMRFITLVNASEKAAAEQNNDLTARVFAKVLEYCEDHFRREEVMQMTAGYPDYERHKKLHQAMTTEARDLWQAFNREFDLKKKTAFGETLNELLKGWLVNHLLKEDLKLKPYFGKKAQTVQPKPGTSPAKPATEVVSRETTGVRTNDVEYQLPPELAHLLIRLECTPPAMPLPEGGFEDFERLCEASIHHRINKILVFFQRSNPDVVRALPPVFLGSPQFADKFHAAVARFIMPVIKSSRQVKMMSTHFDCSGVDTEDFWGRLPPILKDAILACWSAGWDDLRLVEVVKADLSRVLQVKENTKALRELLAPAEDDWFDLPRVGNAEIHVFQSLLDTSVDWWDQLNRVWDICQDIYEQEKDPRVFQDKARVGAMRDNLLSAFQKFPDQWGDFLILACHRMFPRINTLFVEGFTAHVGRSEVERQRLLPYTMRYLKQVREHPEIRLAETEEELIWQGEMDQLRKFLKGISTNT